MKLTTSLIFAAGLLFAPGATCFTQGGCGIKPIKPITPIGCKDLEAECQCDSTGQKCKWIWKCVK